MVRFFCSHRPASKELFFVGDPEELTQERKCLLAVMIQELANKQVLWYREAPKHVFSFKQEQSSFGIVQLGQSLGSVFDRGMLTPRLFWMGQLGWTFSRFNHETDIPKVNGFRSWDETVVPGSQPKSFRTTWWIVGLELEVLENSWRRKVTKVPISAANPRWATSVLIDDELLQLDVIFFVKTWWSLKGTRLKPKEWVNSLNCGPFMDQNPFYSATDIDVQPNKEKVNRWWELDVAV